MLKLTADEMPVWDAYSLAAMRAIMSSPLDPISYPRPVIHYINLAALAADWADEMVKARRARTKGSDSEGFK
jgi:hypothetical protein